MSDTDLQSRVEALEKWKTDRERQQITLPLDQNSITVLMNYFMRLTGTIETIGGAGGNDFVSYIGNQGNLGFIVSQNTYIPVIATPATDLLTVQKGFFEDDMQVNFATSDTLPAPLDVNTGYFVVSAAANGLSFKVSLTQGGAPVNITDAGTGKQYVYFF